MKRSRFLGRIAAGGAAIGLGGAAATDGFAQSEPRRGLAAEHELDRWISELKGEYRLVLDSVSPRGAGEITGYASTYMQVNGGAYGFGQGRTSVVVIVRNMAAAFGFNDDAWSTYGLGEHAPHTDPRTSAPAVRNTAALSMASLVQQGATIAVCAMATQYYAGLIARRQSSSPAEVYKGLESRLIPGARLVPSGITAVDRCQRQQFSYAYVG